MGAPRAATAQPMQPQQQQRAQGGQGHEFHCLEVFRIPRALGATAHGVRNDAGLKRAAQLVVDEQYVVHSKGPFADGALAARAPITWTGEAAVVLVMTVVMGGPLVWSFALPAYLAVAGSWLQVGLYVAATAVLAYHPLPVAHDELYSSWFVEQLYRYFSYRMLWADDCRDEAMQHSPWLGAGVPHGAMPFANVLSVPAVNSFLYGDAEFLGAPASVVFRTPFLRYLTVFKSCTVDGPTLTREMAKGNNVGLVGDGIAGIFQCSDQEEVVALAQVPQRPRQARAAHGPPGSALLLDGQHERLLGLVRLVRRDGVAFAQGAGFDLRLLGQVRAANPKASQHHDGPRQSGQGGQGRGGSERGRG
jgi:hypothetical protein